MAWTDLGLISIGQGETEHVRIAVVSEEPDDWRVATVEVACGIWRGAFRWQFYRGELRQFALQSQVTRNTAKQMKCPKCGWITNWDTLQCPCGYDSTRVIKPVNNADPLPVEKPVSPASTSMNAAVIVIWTVFVLGLTAAAMAFLFFWTIGASIGVNDGANRIPMFLMRLCPIGGLLLLVGGLYFFGSPQEFVEGPNSRVL
jgi:hypothetical protein